MKRQGSFARVWRCIIVLVMLQSFAPASAAVPMQQNTTLSTSALVTHAATTTTDAPCGQIPAETTRKLYLPLIGRGGSSTTTTRASGSNWEPAAVATNPASVAPPLDASVATDFAVSVAFLYTGTNPIQVGVRPDTIDPQKVAVARGCVKNRADQPIAGARVTVLNHPEFGFTTTGADGQFNIVVNGGGSLTFDVSASGFISSQRTVEVPWRDYVWVDDLVLVQFDPVVSTIDLTKSDPFQVARGSAVEDVDGQRQATLLIPQGTEAELVMPDGSKHSASTISIRATEYTVGDSGPDAMPAALPPQSGYTYALEYSVDEAVAEGAIDIRFNQPLYHYVENFLGFPVGMAVPTGYYDRQQAKWIPSNNGRVVRIVSITSGLANLDTSGDGAADNDPALGITEHERERLARLYQAGQSLWRVPITHFTPWDCNWPAGPGPNDTPPPDDPAKPDEFVSDPQPEKPEDKPNSCPGSVIECQNQALGEDIELIGVPFGLHYRSDRVSGRLSVNTLRIPISARRPPASLKRIMLDVLVAGQRFTREYDPFPNQQVNFVWNGQDAYGRLISGSRPARVRLGYVYDAVYQEPANFEQAFGAFSGIPITGNRAREEVTLWREWEGSVGGWSNQSAGLGGWSLGVHHSYDPTGQVLYLGTGERRSTNSIATTIIDTIAGNGRTGNDGDGGPATAARISASSITVGPDGSVYIANNTRIRRVSPDGIISTFAGGGTPSSGIGDGGPAIQARLFSAQYVTFGPDGSLYITENSEDRIRKVDQNGIITTVAGNGTAGYSGDGSLATAAQLNDPRGIAVGPDGSLYIADSNNDRIRRVSPSGFITTFAGGNDSCVRRTDPCGDGGPATEATILSPENVSVAPNGDVYIANNVLPRLRRVSSDGIIYPVADLGLVWQGQGIAFSRDSELYISYYFGTGGSIFQVGSAGELFRIAGTNESRGFSGDGGPPTQARFGSAEGIAVGPDGSIYVADQLNYRIRRIGPALPGTSFGNITFPSEDGSELFVFDSRGRHLRTHNSYTGAVIYEFGYDPSGRISTITDGDGNVTSVARNASGSPTAIVGPFGQRTALTIGADGYLASLTNPANETLQFNYAAAGLLTKMTDARGNSSQYTYDVEGRLTSATNRAGSTKTLTQTSTAGANSTALTDALGRTVSYSVDQLPTADRRRVNTLPDGTTSEWLIRADGSEQVRMPNGMWVNNVVSPNPRFGMLAPVQSSEVVTTPAGLRLTTTREMTVLLTAPQDPLTLTSEAERTTINGQTFTSIYDAASRRFTLTTPLGRGSSTTIDAQGRVVEEAVEGLAPATYGYDSRGRLITVTQGSGVEARTVTIAYNAQSFIEQISDPLGRVTRFAYDGAGRVTVQTLPDGREIRYAYDANGNLTSLTPPGRPAHTFTYTADDLVATYTAPDVGASSSQTAYSYNTARQLTRIARADGQALDYAYDAAGRLSTLTTPRGQTAYSYDATTGNLAGIAAPGGVGLAYTYDGSLLLNETWSGPIAGSVGRSYDNNFRIAATTVNGANSITSQYDSDGLLTQVGNLVLSRDAANGLLTGTALGTANDAWTYNTFAEPASYVARYGTTALYSVTYTRDRLGRITQKLETTGGTTTTYSYGYDQSGRLVEVRQNGTLIEQYVYDTNGNRTSATVRGVAATGTYDNQDRLISYGGATYTYNAHGDLTSKTSGGQTTTYQYDVQSNLISVTLPDGTNIGYVVDGQNRRIGKTVNGALVQGWLYADGLRPIAELDGAGNIVSRFVYASRANSPDYFIKGNVTYRIFHDQLGSPRLVVNTADGSVVQRLDYDAFGNVLQDTNPGFQPFGFAGGLYDSTTGLVRFGARDYDVQVGRWTAKDPIGFASRDMNIYSYVANDPINFKDAEGLAAVVVINPWTIAFGAAVIYYGSQAISTTLEAINNAILSDDPDENIGAVKGKQDAPQNSDDNNEGGEICAEPGRGPNNEGNPNTPGQSGSWVDKYYGSKGKGPGGRGL